VVAGVTALLLAGVGAAAVWAGSLAHQAEGRAAGQLAQLKAAKDQLAVRQQQAARKPSPALAAELAATRAAIAERQGVLAMLDGGAGTSEGFAKYFRGFARQAPNGLWLTAFAIGAGGTGMEIRGLAINDSLVPEYIRRLKGEPAFQGHSFSALNLQQKQEEGKAAAATGRHFIEFTLDPVKIAEPGKGDGAKPDERKS
jgi:hypothetical protein